MHACGCCKIASPCMHACMPCFDARPAAVACMRCAGGCRRAEQPAACFQKQSQSLLVRCEREGGREGAAVQRAQARQRRH